MFQQSLLRCKFTVIFSLSWCNMSPVNVAKQQTLINPEVTPLAALWLNEQWQTVVVLWCSVFSEILDINMGVNQSTLCWSDCRTPDCECVWSDQTALSIRVGVLPLILLLENIVLYFYWKVLNPSLCWEWSPRLLYWAEKTSDTVWIMCCHVSPGPQGEYAEQTGDQWADWL